MTSKSTKLVSAGRNSNQYSGVVNPPVFHASTILFDNYTEFKKALSGRHEGASPYGRHGTPLTRELEAALQAIDGYDKVFVTSSGVTAISTSLLSFLKPGDHLLMVDNTYDPTRRFCKEELAKFNIETTYYDPTIGADIAKLIQPNTKVIFMESPGSLTFELQDIPAIVDIAKANNITTIIDNTWATPLYLDTKALGVDVTIQAGTKYINGHSDVMMGVISCNKKHAGKISRTYKNIGAQLAPDDCYLALRGLRTLAVRLKQHEANALYLAKQFQNHSKIQAVLHPALSGNDIFKRNFTGSSGLFSIVLNKAYNDDELAKFFNHLQHFGMGFSWGGYESLAIPFWLDDIRTATKFAYNGSCIRIHAGLEDKEDLWQDLQNALEQLG